MVATGTAWLGRRSASARARRAAARGTSTWVTRALVTSAGSLTRSPTMLTVTTGPGPASSDPSAARIAARSGHVGVQGGRRPVDQPAVVPPEQPEHALVGPLPQRP